MKQDYENICIGCSKTFVTTDIEAIYCDECWEKMASEALSDSREKSEESDD